MACIHLHPRSLSDIAHSIAIVATNAQASALFSAQKNPLRIPANRPPVFRGLRPRICPRLLRLATNSNVGQASSCAVLGCVGSTETEWGAVRLSLGTIRR